MARERKREMGELAIPLEMDVSVAALPIVAAGSRRPIVGEIDVRAHPRVSPRGKVSGVRRHGRKREFSAADLHKLGRLPQTRPWFTPSELRSMGYLKPGEKLAGYYDRHRAFVETPRFTVDELRSMGFRAHTPTHK